MATLLGFRGHPRGACWRRSADDELVDVFGHDLPAHVRALHEALENTFAPRKLAGTVAPLLKELKEATPRLAHYAEPLARVAVSRVVAQLGRVYSVVTLDNFEQLVAPLSVPADDVEKLIVGASGSGRRASSGGALARVDHRLGVVVPGRTSGGAGVSALVRPGSLRPRRRRKRPRPQARGDARSRTGGEAR